MEEPKLYDVVSLKETPGVVVVAERIGTATTVLAARSMRRVSGDVVVYAGTSTVVDSPEWQWPWERNDSQSYVQKLIRSQRRKS